MGRSKSRSSEGRNCWNGLSRYVNWGRYVWVLFCSLQFCMYNGIVQQDKSLGQYIHRICYPHPVDMTSSCWILREIQPFIFWGMSVTQLGFPGITSKTLIFPLFWWQEADMGLSSNVLEWRWSASIFGWIEKCCYEFFFLNWCFRFISKSKIIVKYCCAEAVFW